MTKQELIALLNKLATDKNAMVSDTKSDWSDPVVAAKYDNMVAESNRIKSLISDQEVLDREAKAGEMGVRWNDIAQYHSRTDRLKTTNPRSFFGRFDTPLFSFINPKEQDKWAELEKTCFAYRGYNKIEREEYQAYINGAISEYKGANPDLNLPQSQGRMAALNTLVDNQGGYLVAEEIDARIESALISYGGMLAATPIRQVGSGNPLDIGQYDPEDDIGEELDQSNANRGSSTLSDNMGSVTRRISLFGSKIREMTIEFVSDATPDMEAWEVEQSIDRVARIMNRVFTNSTGLNASGAQTRTKGLIPSLTVVCPTSADVPIGANSISYDAVLKMLHSVHPSVRTRGTAKWMCHATTLAKIQSIKDTTGAPIWLYLVRDNQMPKDMLFGHEVILNDEFPAFGANQKSLAFGDFTKYQIDQVAGSRVFHRFSEEKAYASAGKVGFVLLDRAGGVLRDPANAAGQVQIALWQQAAA